MSLVLAVEPDPLQAEILRQILRNQIGAELVLVDSKDTAIAAIDQRMPDLILLSALLSPRDEDGVIAYLRSLQHASHLQTLTIPQFRREAQPSVQKISFAGFRKKRPAPAPTGCDPAAFVKEIAAYLAHAQEARSRPALVARPSAAAPAMPTVPDRLAVAGLRLVASPSLEPEESPLGLTSASAEPVIRQFGLKTSFEGEERDSREDGSDRMLTAEVARVQAEAEAKLAAELERVRTEAEERRLAEVARLQAEAEAFRQSTIDEARAVAESEARNALAAEMARVRTEAEETVGEALNRVKTEVEHLARVQEEAGEQSAAAHRSREIAEAEARAMADELVRLRTDAEETLASELARVRAEVEATLGLQLDRAKAEADRLREAELARAQAETEILRAAAAEEARQAAEAAASRALEAEVARVRAEAEARLWDELNRVKEEAEHERFIDQEEAKHTAEKMREAAAREARAVAQMAATRTLDAEIARVRSDAEALLEAELARVRAEAEERRIAELQDIRAQMAEVQEAAAQQARAAAAEAVASEVARATSESPAARRQPNVIRLQPKNSPAASARAKPEAPPVAAEKRLASTAVPNQKAEGGGDYYSLWRRDALPEKPRKKRPRVSRPPRFRRTKWTLPIAATVLLVVHNGVFIDSAAWPAAGPTEGTRIEAAPAEVPKAVLPAVPEKKVGELRVESTPEGARVLIDGRQYGKTPLTVPDLQAGRHTVVLQSDVGMIARVVTIKAGGATDLSESIFSGWLAIFSRIPLDIHVNGKPMWNTDDGQLMIAPGRYEVELINQRLNYRETKTLEVKPGEITAYDVSPPMGVVRVVAPDGVEIRVDGEPAGQTPIGDLSVPIGVREIVATHPERGERRQTVEVRYGEPADVRLEFAN